jgi:hypothetical protein
VLLHQPGGHPVWEGDFRIVTVAKTGLELEFESDPSLTELAWAFLVESLEMPPLAMAHLAGTVTRTSSEPFGDLKSRGPSLGIEVRASWTPTGLDIGDQLSAWLSFLADLGGVELLPAGVVALRPGL